MSALGRLASVAYERPLSTGSRPDIAATLNGIEWSFVADVVTVSDDGFHEQNPYDIFQAYVIGKARDIGLSGAGFDVQVGGATEGKNYYRRRMRLALPRTSAEKADFEQALGALLREVCSAPSTSHRLDHKKGSADIKVTYTPGRRGISGGYPSYTAAYGITNSPVFRALKDKARLLRAVDGGLPKGIIACDGDCSTLQSLHGSPGGFGLRDIVLHFLTRYTHIDFVMCIAVQEQSRAWMHAFPREPVPLVYLFIPERSKDRVPDQASRLLKHVGDLLPPLKMTPANARTYTSHEHKHRTHYASGGWEMADPEIRISARALLNLLTGSISQKEFLQAHGFIPTPDARGPASFNPFKAFAKSGRLFVDARLIAKPQEDDDWIVFRFGEPDPAVSSFQVPGESGFTAG